MSTKHKWRMEEDRYCCKRYVEEYVIKEGSKDLGSFLNELECELGEIPRGSIKMKLQNIKQVLIDLNIEDSLSISPLKQYSKQNKQALEETLNFYGIKNNDY